MDIKINHTGKIINGKFKNWIVKIEDDNKNTGGFIIIQHMDSTYYDNWVLTIDEVKTYLENYAIQIQWED